MDWYQYFLEAAPTVLVGLIGFGGVVVTLKANARLARDIEKAKYDRRANFVRRAVIEELKLFEWIFRNGLEGMRPEPDKDLLVPRMDRVLTPELMPELALLGSDEMEVALKALLGVDQIYSKMAIFSKPIDGQYFHFSADKYELLKKMHEEEVDRLTDAIETVERAQNSV